jgi:hypothetical protein
MNEGVTLGGTSPAGDGEEVDVLYLAGQEPSLAGAWLLVTEADGKPGGTFTAHVLGDAAPSAFGGDVLVRLLRDDPAEGQPPPAARVRVFAVTGGRLIPVAVWPGHDLDSWPERIRPTVAFTMGVLTELEEHGADLGGGVDLAQAEAQAVAGVPLHITFPEGKAATALP